MFDSDETKESTYIKYIDFNNQNGWTLSPPFPYDKFSDFDYMLIVDVEYLK